MPKTYAEQGLPDPSELLPGSSRFCDHPGYAADACPIREIVVAATYASNNGFRCGLTGGHCVPGEHCEARRARVAKREQVSAMLRGVLPAA